MGRIKKKNKKNRPSWYEHFDWSIDPQTTKEIVAIVAFALGVLFLLSIFGGAGKFGVETFRALSSLFGLAGFLIPFALLAIGISFWKIQEAKLKGPTAFGLLVLFLSIPALFMDYGGSVGKSVYLFFYGLFGPIAGYLILLAITIIALLLSTNLSITQIKNWLFGSGEGEDEEKTEEAKVSVFQTVKNKFGSRPQTGVENTAVPAERRKTFDMDWKLPPIDLLPVSTSKATSGNISKNVETIQKTLKDFGINVTMGDVHIGPTVTQYTLKPSEGVKLNAITSRANDLALALAAHPIRVEAPIPGKSAVGIEIPNKVPAIVTLREILESNSYKNVKSNLALAIGRDVSGSPIAVDLQKMPHLLIAGATGSGKSVAINGIIMSLIMSNSPADLRLILVDPKRVEFSLYNNIPHLLTPVVTEVDKTINTLRWAVAEMEKRFKLFAETHKRNISEYNANPSDGHMPYLVVIIDELADLMSQAANEAEAAIVRLAQLARATGIHLIVATQRPSVDVITGLIKANITTRIAFAVASQVDSRTIIDQGGADKLLGNGDMLYLSAEFGMAKRIQGVLVGERDIKSVTDFLKNASPPDYDESIAEYRPAGIRGSIGEGSVDDDMFEDAKQVVVQAGKGSASLLQRRLRVGYARAARLLDLLEQEGIIGPPEGSKPRDVLVSSDMIGSQSSPHDYSYKTPPPNNESSDNKFDNNY